jgi:hypothetical protein
MKWQPWTLRARNEAEIIRLRHENKQLRTIAKRIVDARERDDWNDLDDAVDDLIGLKP